MTDRNHYRTSSNWTGRTPRTMSDAFGTAGPLYAPASPVRLPRVALAALAAILAALVLAAYLA